MGVRQLSRKQVNLVAEDEGTVASRNISSMCSRLGIGGMSGKRPTMSNETRILLRGGSIEILR